MSAPRVDVVFTCTLDPDALPGAERLGDAIRDHARLELPGVAVEEVSPWAILEDGTRCYADRDPGLQVELLGMLEQVRELLEP